MTTSKEVTSFLRVASLRAMCFSRALGSLHTQLTLIKTRDYKMEVKMKTQTERARLKENKRNHQQNSMGLRLLLLQETF